jgi:hypothetical protein
MGQEKQCRMRRGGRVVEGKAMLETDHLRFRGGELGRARATPGATGIKIFFRDLTGISASGGALRLAWGGTSAEFELGGAAEKWAQKILHPPSRLDKLGVKPGVSVRLHGVFDDEFTRELKAAGAVAARELADLVFLSASRRADLARISALARQLQPAGGLWVIYPKGVEPIREIDVIEAGRVAGLKDTKVASFSSTHTALRFTIPVAARGKMRRAG